jgi:hypothetical protein
VSVRIRSISNGQQMNNQPIKYLGIGHWILIPANQCGMIDVISLDRLIVLPLIIDYSLRSQL